MKQKFLPILALLLGCLLVSSALKAQTFDPNFTYTIRHEASYKVLEIGGGGTVPIKEGSRANLWDQSGGANQEWYIRSAGSGFYGTYYKIISRGSGQLLEIGGSDSRQMEEGAFANQWPDYGGDNQLWYMRGAEIINVKSGLALYGDTQAVPSGSVYQLNGYFVGSGTNWNISLAAGPGFFPAPQRNGVYTLVNKKSNQLLEVGGNSVNGGAAVNQWPYFGNANQQWIIEDLQQGFFSIRNRNSKQALEVGGSNAQHYQQGRPVNQWPYNGGEQQQWAINFTTGAITNRKSGQVLEIGGSNSRQMETGALANQWPDFGGANQRWTINYVSQYRASVVTAAVAAKAENEALSVYPNPATSVLTFSLANNAKSVSVVVTDMRGVVVKEARAKGEGQVDISNVATGIYVLAISDGKLTYHRRFMKQ